MIRAGGNELDILRAIEREDPAGYYTRQPTPADYAAHRDWAISRYGRALWDTYRRGGWGPSLSQYE